MIEYENLKKLNSEFENEFKECLVLLLKSGWYILGKETEKFEKEFSQYISTKHAIGVGNGLDAMVIALRALDLPKDSEVIVPANTYIATILAVLLANLKPVLVEPRIDTYTIDSEKIQKSITRKTKAIIVVHLYGKSCDMDPIQDLCSKHNLILLEDCAQSHGAKYKGKTTGSFGIGCFSFYPTKNLGALGDGGAITVDDGDIYLKIKAIRNYGSHIKYENKYIGLNSRLDEIQSSFLSIKLKSLDKINNHKRKLAQIYHNNLTKELIKPVLRSDYEDVFHIYNVRTQERDRLRDYLLKRNIKTEIHYPISPSKQEALKSLFLDNFPISEEIHSTTLSLPISYSHTEDEIFKVSNVVNSFFNK
jgi:dTDP-4-amino-4,6-dideoxygalactose transaminase